MITGIIYRYISPSGKGTDISQKILFMKFSIKEIT